MATINAPPPPVNAGAALRALTRSRAQADPPLQPPGTGTHTISRSTDAVNFILSATGVPANFRAFVDAVIGAAHTELEPTAAPDDWFEARDLDLGKRALADRYDAASALALKKWIQRQRKAFFNWQEKSGVTLIKCEPGGMDTERNNHDSRYSAPLLLAAEQLLVEAASDPAWTTNRDRAMQAAATVAVAGLPGGPGKRERFKRPRKDSSAMLKRNMATIQSLFKKNLDILARKAGFNADMVIASAEQHYCDAMEGLQAALDDVREQAERAKAAMLPARTETTAPRADAPAMTLPVDKCVHTPRRLAVAPAAVSDCNSSSDPMDKCVHTPAAAVESVHSLNIDRSGQTQGGYPLLADAALAPDETQAPPLAPVTDEAPPAPLLAAVHPMDRCVHTPLDTLAEAMADVACFEQVGVQSFDVSLVGEVMRTGERELAGFWAGVQAAEFRQELPRLLERCARVRLNLIVRPRAPGLRLVQLDDLDADRLAKVQRCAFRVIETSPGSFQAWVGVSDGDEEIERELKEAAGADVGANGTTRLVGSLNVKEIYRPGYPVVRLIAAGRRVLDVAELRAVGLIAATCKPPCVHSLRLAPSDRESSLPDYGEFVRNARLTAAGEIDRSAVDFAWAATALKRGHSAEVVCAELERVSLKAAALAGRSRRAYIRRTVSKAQRSIV